MNLKDEIIKAEKRIRKYIRETPLEYSPYLGDICKCKVYLKLESEQLLGAFKIRGALNKLLSLDTRQRQKGIIAASSGNHGIGVAYGLKILKMNGTIYLPTNASSAKIEAIRQYETPIKFYSNDVVNTEMFARKQAVKKHMIFISPYNDLEVIAGHGTIGIELVKQLPGLDTVLGPIGGGGLISGVSSYLKLTRGSAVKIFGCLPEASPVMSESIKAGKIIDMEVSHTLSDGTAGGIEPNSITFDICKEYVDDYFLVNEKEIKQAIILILAKHHKIIEGAAALSVAALIRNKTRFKNKKVVLIISGSNISIDKIKAILQ